MKPDSRAADRIIAVVSRSRGCRLDELVFACPDLTWNQIFLAVDGLSRAGQVRLTLEGAGQYTVTCVDTGDHGEEQLEA